MAVSVIPTDGRSHAIQIYSDITAEWTSGDDAKVVNWTTWATTDTVTHQIQLQSPSPFSEVDDHAECKSKIFLALEISLKISTVDITQNQMAPFSIRRQM